MEYNKMICTVCGYIHQGSTPPDECPICGATAEYFEPYVEEQSEVPAASAKWRCLNCEYIHAGSAPPDICPVCGAPKERFEAYEEVGGQVEIRGPGIRVVIIGGGIAGISAAEAARKTMPDAEIRLITRDEELPYYRLNLTRYLAGEVTAQQLSLHPAEWYEKKNIQLKTGIELCTLDRENQTLHFRNGESLVFDKLVLTMGAHPFIPPFPGAARENVTPLRTKKDADFIISQCRDSLHCVIIGGGVLGLETAGALAKRGVNVALLEGYGWLMPRQLNRKAGDILEKYVKALGISLYKEARVKEIVGDERAREVLLEDGRSLPAELVIITTGVRSNSYMARLAGLEVNRGIVVDNALCSSAPNIYAAGDVAEHRGVSYGTWGPSQFQGSIAGINAAGGRAEFAGIARSNMLKVLDVDMFSIGEIIAVDAGSRIYDDESGGSYYFFMFRDNHLIGAILLGDTALSPGVKKAVEEKKDFSELLSGNPDVKDILGFFGR